MIDKRVVELPLQQQVGEIRHHDAGLLTEEDRTPAPRGQKT
jgi:hypothetical protein